MSFKKIKRITFFGLVFFTLSAMFTSYALWRPIKPGDHVYDASRHNEQMLATAQLMAQVVNSIKKINNQLTNLTSSGGETSVQGAKINSKLDNFNQTLDESGGMMNKNMSADTVFNSVFKDPTDMELKSYEYQKTNQAAISTLLENTCKDLLKLSYASQDTAQDAEFLAETMDLNANIPGNLAGKQLKNITLAAQIKQQIQSERLDVAVAAVKIARAKADMFLENIAERKNRNMVVLSYDPYNPTSEDKLNYQHKPSPGLMKFK